MRIEREWAMPSGDTFSIRPIAELAGRVLEEGVIVDPFARNSLIGTHRNDLNPDTLANYHLDAIEFLDQLITEGVVADSVIFDPPYSPRQISELYNKVGRVCGTADTQSGRLYREVKTRLAALLRVGGVAISCGWNSAGLGKKNGMEIQEILLVAHGGAHNDTIVTVERKLC